MLITHKKERFNVIPFNSTFSHILGLMFKKKINNGGILIFKKENYVAIHTFFVFYPIDVIYLNKDKIVTCILRKVKPYNLLPYKKARYILELKNENKINIGEKIKFNKI